MQSILAVAIIAGFAAAEVPSHSYLPPPPHRGYSSGPAVVAARALQPHLTDHTTDSPIGFTRSSTTTHEPTHPQARYTEEQGYETSSPSSPGYARNALEDVNATVSYDADQHTFKPQILQESEDLARSSPGYDSNANNIPSTPGYRSSTEQNGAGYRATEQNGGRPSARSNGYN